MFKYLPCFYINVKKKLVDIKHKKFYNDAAIYSKNFLHVTNYSVTNY